MNYYFPVQIKKTLSIFFCTFISFHFVFHRRFITSYICKNVGFNALFKCKVVSLLTNLSDFAIWLMTLLEGKFRSALKVPWFFNCRQLRFIENNFDRNCCGWATGRCGHWRDAFWPLASIVRNNYCFKRLFDNVIPNT